MSSNVREFTAGVDRFADAIPEMVGKRHRAVMLEGLRGVVLMTPVDKGRARGNWQVSMDTPASGEVETTDKSGGATIAQGSQKIQQVQPYSISWISNNVPYIQRLEDGWSQQAPRGMLAVTFARLKGWLARQR